MILPKFGFRLLVARYVETLRHALQLPSVEYVDTAQLRTQVLQIKHRFIILIVIFENSIISVLLICTEYFD